MKGFATIYMLAGGLFLASLGLVYYFGIGKSITLEIFKENPKACTQEAKQCPDGSFVGRTGANCEFKPCSSLKPLPLSGESINLKTYENKNLGISFQYSNNWNMTTTENNSISLTTSTHLEAAGGILEQDLDSIIKIQITKLSPPRNLTQWFKDLYGKINDYHYPFEIIDSNKKKIKVDNIDAFQFETYATEIVEMDTLFIYKDKGYSVSFSGVSTGKNEEAYQTVLKTFKFLDQKQTSAEGQFCGGVVGVECPDGYICKLDGNYPDASGKCGE